jgi:hypothetical protein
VGTPKGRLSALEEPLLKLSWREARPSVKVKLLAHENECYVLAAETDVAELAKMLAETRAKT